MVRMKKKYRAVYRAGRKVLVTAGSELKKNVPFLKKKAKKFAKKNLNFKRKTLKQFAAQRPMIQINTRNLYS